MRELETIATTSVTAAEVCSLRAHYFPELKKGGPGAVVTVALDDPGKKIFNAIRSQQGRGAVFLLREKLKS